MSPVAFPRMSFDGQAPPAPHYEVVTSGEFSPELSSPPSPQLRSTARSHSRYHLACLCKGSLAFLCTFTGEGEQWCFDGSVCVSVHPNYSRCPPALNPPTSRKSSAFRISQRCCQVGCTFICRFTSLDGSEHKLHILGRVWKLEKQYCCTDSRHLSRFVIWFVHFMAFEVELLQTGFMIKAELLIFFGTNTFTVNLHPVPNSSSNEFHNNELKGFPSFLKKIEIFFLRATKCSFGHNLFPS